LDLVDPVLFINTPNIPAQTLGLGKRKGFFFFFFKFARKVTRRGPKWVAGGGERRLTVTASGWRWLLDPNIFGLETCIGPVKWANILAINHGPFEMIDPQ
jgi:hypothetical protein